MIMLPTPRLLTSSCCTRRLRLLFPGEFVECVRSVSRSSDAQTLPLMGQQHSGAQLHSTISPSTPLKVWHASHSPAGSIVKYFNKVWNIILQTRPLCMVTNFEQIVQWVLYIVYLQKGVSFNKVTDSFSPVTLSICLMLCARVQILAEWY